jgi:acetyl-CoA carboxylase biotin carboxyl carrier protein
MADPDKRTGGAGAGAGKAATGKAPEAPESGTSQDPTPGQSPETASLLGLIDKLSGLLERSELVELEVEAGETGIVLRKPAALAPLVVETAAPTPAAAGAAVAPAATPAEAAPSAADLKVVRAPLTGIFYAAPSPTAPPYVTAGQHVTTGQVIGLIEAMKLFNEIKSDVTGRVVRIVAESGKLVKTKQPLIEVEP